MKNTISLLSIIFGLIIFISSCSKDLDVDVTFEDVDFETTDWTDETHSKDADPNFDEVFEDNTVKRLDFVFTEERWQTMLDDMTNSFGSFGSGGNAGLTETDENPVFVPGEVYYNGKQ